MKHIILFCIIIVCVSHIAAAQDTVVNPTVIQQPMNIVLQHTDVYYCPFAPPSPTDTRAQLSNQAEFLRDSDGLVPGFPFNHYTPMTHGTILASWHPCASWPDTLGPNVAWQRLFTARNQPGGIPSDIIVGSHVTDSVDTGMVIISKNEDVDFRASGTIKMENGFHVMPGAFFHAYQEPKWGDSVFCDEFDSGLSQWFVAYGHGEGGGGMEASYDSNATIVSDSDAHDGHALDIAIHMDTVNRFPNLQMVSPQLKDSCNGDLQNTSDTGRYLFSSAKLRACPWPYTQRDSQPLVSAYQHAPYGKYEIREKIPLTPHHSNNWLNAYTEFDMNEWFQNYSGLAPTVNPDIYRNEWHGPFKGMFHKMPDSTVIFVSHAANWSLTNNPSILYIDQFPYEVTFDTGHVNDTVVATGGRSALMGHNGWPYSLSNSTDSITFYYARQTTNTTDSMPWTVTTDGGGTWRVLSTSYCDSSGDSLRFSKGYQPTSITLTGYDSHGHPDSLITFACHWEYNLNNPDTTKGLIYLDDTMLPTGLHGYREQYQYTVNEMSAAYPIPGVPFDTTQYEYHTFGLEVLPHEVRFLLDSNVVRRVPDRMIPPGNPQFDYASQIDRAPLDLRIAEVDYEYDQLDTNHISFLDTNHISFVDSMGTYDSSYLYYGQRYWRSTIYLSRQYFEQRIMNPDYGFWNNAAQHRVDYVKIWDVPSDVYIPGFPN